MMNQKKKFKAAAKRKRIRKLKKELELLALGAGMIWDDGYFMYEVNGIAKSIGTFMWAVCEKYDLQNNHIFSFHCFEYWDDLDVLSKQLDKRLQVKKEEEKQDRLAEEESS